MFSPITHVIRQRIFSQVVHTPLTSSSTVPIEPDELDILEPDMLLWVDQVAFFDLKEHEDHYDIVVSTSFDFSLLNFTQTPIPTNQLDIDTKAVVHVLHPSMQHKKLFID
ncbi:hypothetical protein RSAG8_07329, partial [Rhizoctonia solani AG-8 WAC10335]